MKQVIGLTLLLCFAAQQALAYDKEELVKQRCGREANHQDVSNCLEEQIMRYSPSPRERDINKAKWDSCYERWSKGEKWAMAGLSECQWKIIRELK